MSAGGAKWSDLRRRALSGVLMLVLGAFGVYQGGLFFVVMVCAICGAMVWETARMFATRQAVGLGIAAGVAMLALNFLPGTFALPLMLGLALVAASQTAEDGPLAFVVIAWVLLACFALLWVRAGHETLWILWLILVVIASDVAGYFAGRMLGGPKFWPRFSPKKTWSGTIAGWLLAGIVGLFFLRPLGMGLELIPMSMLAGFAGQMGDIAESAVKRRKGIKDSSSLIPGHGGVFDRFDAMLGGSAAALLFWAVGLMPGAGG